MFEINVADATNDQKEGLRLITKWYNEKSRPFFILGGSAGTGKTSTIKWVIEELNLTESYSVACFTAKAAQRVREEGLINVSTIHRLIYKVLLDQNDTFVGFAKKRRHELEHIKLIIIDEYSTAGDKLVEDLLYYNIPILFVGDKNQCEPYKEKQTLFDKPNFELKELTRFAKSSPIIWIAQKILKGETIEYGKYGKDVIVARKIKDEVLLRADQILCATNRTKNRYNKTVRRLKGCTSDVPIIGDKVICRNNNWQKVILDKKDITMSEQAVLTNGVYLLNGLAGEITSTPIEEEFMYTDKAVNRTKFCYVFNCNFKPYISETEFQNVRMDYDSLMLGTKESEKKQFRNGCDLFNYGLALCIYSSQGSEWNKGILDFRDSFGDKEFQKKMLYTGITRFRKKLILLI